MHEMHAGAAAARGAEAWGQGEYAPCDSAAWFPLQIKKNIVHDNCFYLCKSLRFNCPKGPLFPGKVLEKA
jgi:hypothetical protein